MFGWFGGKHRAEVERLRVENSQLKAAAAGTPQDLVAGAGGTLGGMATTPNLTAAREQLRHFKGYQYIAINAIAKRAAGQAIYVGYKPSAPAGPRMTKAAKIGDTTGIEVLEGHELLDAIDDPNELFCRFQLIYVTLVRLLLAGRSYWWFRDDGERLTIWPLPPDWVTPEHINGRLNARWLVRPPGMPDGFHVDGDDMAYFFMPSATDNSGVSSPLSAQSPAVNLSDAIDQAHIATMYNSAKPGVILRAGRLELPPGVPGQGPRPVLTPEQRVQLLEAMKKAYEGMLRYGRTAIVDGLIEDIFPFSSGESDVDYQGGSKLARDRIMQSYGVHPFMVGADAPGSYAQAAAVERVMADGAINPILTMAGQVISAWGGSRFSGPRGEKLIVWFEPTRARDDDLEFRKMNLLASKQVLTKDELRAYGGLPPLAPGMGGDELIDESDSTPAFDPAAVKLFTDASDPYTPPRINGHDRLKALAEAARG